MVSQSSNNKLISRVNKEAALVVFSGGQDSTTCLFWAKREFKKVYALSFLYGQKHRKEVDLAREIARKAGVEFEVMDVSLIGKLGRNSLTDTGMAMDEEKPAEKTPEGGKPVSDSPKTGDNTNLWLWFMLLGIGATGTGALAFMRKKKH